MALSLPAQLPLCVTAFICVIGSCGAFLPSLHSPLAQSHLPPHPALISGRSAFSAARVLDASFACCRERDSRAHGSFLSTLRGSSDVEVAESQQGCLSGRVIAITGNFDGCRDEVMDLIKRNGATFSGTVHKNVNFLVTDQAALESQTKHIRKAEKFGTLMVQRGFLEECERQGAVVDAAPYKLG